MSRHRADLDDRLDALARAVDLGQGRCDPAVLAPARALLDRASARRRLSPERTVVALAGGTGSGKSTLFNALAGASLAPTGVRRPTTSRSRAAIWPSARAESDDAVPDACATDDVVGLLEWLDIRDRHTIVGAAGTDQVELAGLVLVDLPDFDSTAAAHRLEAERMTRVVDLLVWVVDPQKYADAALHERYLRPLAAHRDVTMVVLNQADRLDPGALEACRRHLASLLTDDGLPGVALLATSAVRGDGLDELRRALAQRVRARTSAVARLHADVDTAVSALDPLCGGPAGAHGRTTGGRGAGGRGAGSRAGGEDGLVRALSQAAGAGQAADAAARSYRMRATARVGWPATSWLSRLRPDPVRRLHLAPGTSGPQTRTATGTQRAQVSNALRDLVAERTSAVAPAWQAAARTAVQSRQDQVPGELDKAVRASVPPLNDRPRWWAAVRALQLLFLAAAVAGLLWLAVLAAFAYLHLPQPDFSVGRLPLPTVLLFGGLIAGLATSLLVRPFVAAGARRRRARTRRALDAAVREVARREILTPLEAELDAAAAFCQAVDEARR